jgi:biotin/methionine sulfoxide reductase
LTGTGHATRYTAHHWGVYEVRPGAGRPTLHPLALDPDPSPIGLDQLTDDVLRLRVARPCVRQSWLEAGPGAAPERRGAEPFVEVEWDAALDLVAGDLARVRGRYGNTAIFGGSYGWSSAGRFHHAQSQVHRFLNQLGGYVRHVDTYSLGAGRALMPHIATSMDESNANSTSWLVLAEHTELFVAFGGVPAKNGQVAPGGPARHRVGEGLRAMGRAGVRFVNISPVRDNLDTGGEVEWIPIRPNTDTALMLGLAHAICRDPLFDRSFIDRCTVGFERFAPYLLGETDGAPKTPAWAAAITGVPETTIVALAHDMLRRRTMLNCAWALQRAAHGEQPFWMLVTLACMVGQVGLPGGGYALGYGAANTLGTSHVHLPGPVLSQGHNPVPDFIPVARIADMLLEPGASFTYQGQTHAYPHIRLIYWAGGNPFHHHQDLNRLRRAWARPETIVVHEQYWTPSARFADIVLPATTALERDDIAFAGREGYVAAMRQAAAPFAESRHDYEIFADLAGRLGVGAAFTEGLDPAGWLRRIYDENLPRAAAAGVALPSFDDFWARGLIDLAEHDAPTVMHAAFRADPDAAPLKTPSGKIEIHSERIAGFGLADCPGHPVWLEPFEWLGHPRAKAGGQRLVSRRPRPGRRPKLGQSP